MVAVIVFSSVSSLTFAQEKTKTQPFFPSDESEGNLEIQIKGFKDSIKKEGYFSTLIAYKAVRNKNLSICNSSGDSGECMDAAEPLLKVRESAQGNCSVINEPELRELCLGLKNNCSELSGWMREMCEGFLKEDIKLLESATNSSDFAKIYGGKLNKDDVMVMLSCFLGSKYYDSKKACERFTSALPLSARYMCDVIFGTNDVDEILDKIAFDVAYFTVAKQYKNDRICNQIKDDELKKSCLDPRVGSIRDIW